MRAATFVKAGEDLAVEEVQDPVVGASELIIRVKACGICGSDLHMADVHDFSGGMKPLRKGVVMGHEFCGEVCELGQNAGSKFKVGDRVTALPFVSCGHCFACLSGSGHRCSEAAYTGLGELPGGYADYVKVSPHETLHLPDGLDWNLGALVEPLAVGLHSVRAAKLNSGESTLIIGAGPVGLATALWCRYFGARHVVVSDRVPERLGLAEKMGATAVINAEKEDVIGSFKRIVGARPSVILECVGVPGTQQLAMDYAPAGGRIVVVGVCMAPDTILPVKAITKELQVNYVYMYNRQDFELALDLMHRELIDPTPMISGNVTFEDFPRTFENLKNDKTACKVILMP
jgi:(R,R)-butanediol dehydrogenase/meso-butanediol dehydrogenase/diacetyl reductase